MKEIELTFNQLKINSNLGDYILFANSIRGRNYPDGSITKMFNKLVNKQEYSRSDVPFLMKHLNNLSRVLK